MKHGREIYTVPGQLKFSCGLILAENVGYEGHIFWFCGEYGGI